MFRWRKLGLVFSPASVANRPAWMHEYAQAPNVVIYDDFIRVFFCCRPPPDEKKQFISRCAFVDLDRKNLFKIVRVSTQPVLELGGLGDFDEFGTYPVSVIRDEENLLAYYGGWTRCVSVPFDVALGVARSKNRGESFEKLGRGPVLSASMTEPFVITSPKIRKYDNVWYLFYTAGRRWFIDNGRAEIIYKLRMATSQDGMVWKRLNKDIMEDALGAEEAQACPDVIFSQGRYHMFFCYRQATDFRKNKRNSYRIGYASSFNLTDWTRDDKRVGIEPSEDGFDSEMVAYPTVFALDDSVFMLYLGNEVGRCGFGLAKLQGMLE